MQTPEYLRFATFQPQADSAAPSARRLQITQLLQTSRPAKRLVDTMWQLPCSTSLRCTRYSLSPYHYAQSRGVAGTEV